MEIDGLITQEKASIRNLFINIPGQDPINKSDVDHLLNQNQSIKLKYDPTQQNNLISSLHSHSISDKANNSPMQPIHSDQVEKNQTLIRKIAEQLRIPHSWNISYQEWMEGYVLRRNEYPKSFERYSLDNNIQGFHKSKLVQTVLRTYLQNQIGNGKPIIRMPWSKIKSEDIINWPKHLPLTDPERLHVKFLDSLLRNLDIMTFSPEFIRLMQEDSNKGRRKLDIKRGLVANHFRTLFSLQTGLNLITIPWSKIRSKDLIGWPSNIKIQKPRLYKREELALVIQSLYKVKFTSDFVDKILVENRHQLSKSFISQDKGDETIDNHDSQRDKAISIDKLIN